MEMTLVDFFESAPLLISFLAGVLTFFSPCVLPLIPAYLSYISGVSVKDLSSDSAMDGVRRRRLLTTSLMFVAGFGVIFVLLGVSMASLIDDLFSYPWVNWLAGGVVILFGLHIMGVISIRFLNYERRAVFGEMQKASLIGPFILGVSFALGWTPCIGPIFATIVSMAAQEPTRAVSLMVVYTIGLAVPFVLAGLLTSRALHFFNAVKRHFRTVEIVAGGLLVLVGAAIATGGLSKMSAYLMQAVCQ